MPVRILIVGGVAGGASAAARARRLSEEADIVLFERGPHVSFANCGLPYFIGGEISEAKDLLVQTPEGLRRRFNLDVRVLHEVTAIDPDAKTITVRDLSTGTESVEPYDELILAPGASPVKPPLPGIDRLGHFTLRNVPDTLAIDGWICEKSAKTALVVGGGYIGLEMAEQLTRRGLKVTLVEAMPQVLRIFDPEMAALLHAELQENGVRLVLNDSVSAFEEPAPGESAAASTALLKSGERLPADIVVMGIGVRPEVGLARAAGIPLGSSGGILVNEYLQTGKPHIWAVGDAIEVTHRVTGKPAVIPLAGPANRQGRAVADNIFGQLRAYKGTWGSSVLRLFSLTAAATGAFESQLKGAQIAYEVVQLHPNSHAGYYPGGSQIALKVIFQPETGAILGAQAVGKDGVEKRIDVIATAMQAGMKVQDLAELELCYAPPVGSAKDPVNLAGMMAQDIMEGLVRVAQWNNVPTGQADEPFLLDVRDDDEFEEGALPGAVNIPLAQLRARLSELPQDREIVAYCRSGQRSYYACRILSLNGYSCRNLTGAYLTWAAGTGPSGSTEPATAAR